MVPDWKGEAGAGKCQCRNSNSGSGETRSLCEDADYKPPADDPCFHGDDTVALEAGGVRKISEVQVGDRILSADRSGGLSYSDVVFVPHAPNGRPSAFLELRLASGKTVRPTPRHLPKLCGDDGAFATAASLDPGACLLTADGEDVLVSKRPFEAHGAYTAGLRDAGAHRRFGRGGLAVCVRPLGAAPLLPGAPLAVLGLPRAAPQPGGTPRERVRRRVGHGHGSRERARRRQDRRGHGAPAPSTLTLSSRGSPRCAAQSDSPCLAKRGGVARPY